MVTDVDNENAKTTPIRLVGHLPKNGEKVSAHVVMLSGCKDEGKSAEASETVRRVRACTRMHRHAVCLHHTLRTPVNSFLYMLDATLPLSTS